jgi:hypothetical protein
MNAPNTHISNTFATPPLFLRIGMGAAAAASLILFLSAVVGMGGCASDTDDAVGHTKTVEKHTIDTPNEKVTTTETHEKDTHYVR